MFKLLAVGGSAAALLALPAPATGQLQGPPPGRVTVNVESINGSGCPAGTASVRTSPDNTSFTVTYRDYVARDGAGAQPTDIRKNCQISLQINIPQGFTYAIGRADYSGDVHLGHGATAQQNAYYYFMGSSPTAHVSDTFTGPRGGEWHTSTVAEVATLVYARCGERVNFNINTDLRVNAGAAERVKNYISMDSSKGSLSTVYHFSWKRCY